MRDLIIISSNLTGLPSTSVEIVKCLKNIGRVVWVNVDYLPSPITRAETHRAQLHSQKMQTSIANQPTNQSELTLQISNVPLDRLRGNCNEAKQHILAQLAPFMDQHRIFSPLIWTSDFAVTDLHLDIEGASLVFYSDREQHSCPRSIGQEMTMVQHADIIFGATEEICSRYPAHKTFLLRHGVDLKLFCSPSEPASDLPSGKPIAGFYGDLDESVDYQMLMLCALNTPTWNFVVLGENRLPYYPLPKLDNVFYLGPKKHEEIPSYSQHWQASLLPIKALQNDVSNAEATILEYLAVGSPVITTANIANNRFNKYVNLVGSGHEMSTALKLAAYEPKSAADIVFSDCWQVRSRYVDSILNSYSLANI